MTCGGDCIHLHLYTNAGDHRVFANRVLPYVEQENAPMQSERLRTTEDLAAYFQVVPRTIERWRAQRKIPFRRIGSVIRYDLDEVKSHVNAKYNVPARQSLERRC